MNALTLVFVALCVFALAYRYYGMFIATKVLGVDPKRPTPAHTLEDGIDYQPDQQVCDFRTSFCGHRSRRSRCSGRSWQPSSDICRAPSGSSLEQ